MQLPVTVPNQTCYYKTEEVHSLYQILPWPQGSSFTPEEVSNPPSQVCTGVIFHPPSLPCMILSSPFKVPIFFLHYSPFRPSQCDSITAQFSIAYGCEGRAFVILFLHTEYFDCAILLYTHCLDTAASVMCQGNMVIANRPI